MQTITSLSDAYPDRLIHSTAAPQAVAEHYRCFGYKTEVPPIKLKEDGTPDLNYRDSGDVFIWLGGVRYRIEVKQKLDIHFTCAEDFPFPTIYICKQETWLAYEEKPFAFFVVNDKLTHAAVIDAVYGWLFWGLEDTIDRGKPYKVFSVPTNKVRWIKLEKAQ